MSSNRRKLRPHRWSKKKALEVATSPGTITRKLRELSGPFGLSWRTLYADIHAWRKADPSFAADYEDALSAKWLAAAIRARTFGSSVNCADHRFRGLVSSNSISTALSGSTRNIVGRCAIGR